ERGHEAQGHRHRHILGITVDHHHQLDLMLDLARDVRKYDGLSRIEACRGGLHEEDGLGRRAAPGLRGVVGIVAADADDLHVRVRYEAVNERIIGAEEWPWTAPGWLPVHGRSTHDARKGSFRPPPFVPAPSGV